MKTGAANARRADGPAAIALVEEAVHLLRRAPPGTLALYYAGAVPWTVGLLYFWAWAAWFAPDGPRLAWAALGLVALFGGLKLAQAELCARLLAFRLGRPPPAPTARRLLGELAFQLRWQSWGLFFTAAALVLTVPFGWVYAFFQNLGVIGNVGRASRPGARAAEQAALWPGQNHLGLLLIGGVSAYVWANCAVLFYFLPQLAHRLLGVRNFTSVGGVALLLNTTFLASTVALAWLAVDPLVKAFYVLRVFYGEARRTGEDLRGDLAAARHWRPALAGAASALALLGAVLAAPAPLAAAAVATPAAVSPAALDHAIDEALKQQDFEWQLRPLPKPGGPREEGAIAGFLRDGVRMIEDALRAIGRWLGKIGDWLGSRAPSADSKKSSAAGGGLGNPGWLTGLLYTLLAAAAALIVFVIWQAWRKGRGAAPVLAARAVAAAAPDLRDENVQAAQLPADGWLALARGQLAAGEWRLALRALYLASLARLAAEGLLALAKAKTNLDYERELARRAPGRGEVVAGFRRRRREFEDSWYGWAPAAEPQVRAWLAELDGGATP